LLWDNDPLDKTNSILKWKPYSNQNPIWDDLITDLLSKNGFTDTIIRVFRWPPNKDFVWHIDGRTDGNPILFEQSHIDQFAINWVLEGSGLIQWNSNLNLFRPTHKKGVYAFQHIQGHKDDYYEEQTNGHACLINTSIPHRVVNYSDTHRITVSILFNNGLTFDQAAEKLKSCGLIENDKIV
jgi:hypothetical protein